MKGKVKIVYFKFTEDQKNLSHVINFIYYSYIFGFSFLWRMNTNTLENNFYRKSKRVFGIYKI